VATFHFLNPIIYGLTKVTLVDNDSIFGALISNVTTLHGLLKNELGLLCHSHVKLEDDVLPLIWWKSHKTWFPNVSFVV
jgi:hypothetical protein